jgi:hypothetical protein
MNTLLVHEWMRTEVVTVNPELCVEWTTNLSPTVVGHSIRYGHGVLTERMTYGTVSLLPLFISSVPKLWISLGH